MIFIFPNRTIERADRILVSSLYNDKKKYKRRASKPSNPAASKSTKSSIQVNKVKQADFVKMVRGKSTLIRSYQDEKGETINISIEKKSPKIVIEHTIGERRKNIKIGQSNLQALVELFEIIEFIGEDAYIYMDKVSGPPRNFEQSHMPTDQTEIPNSLKQFEQMPISQTEVLENNSAIVEKKQYRGKVTKFLTLATRRLDCLDSAISPDGEVNYFQIISLGIVREEGEQGSASPVAYLDIRNWSKKRNAGNVDEERPTKVGVRINQKMLKKMKKDSKILIEAITNAADDGEEPPTRKRKYATEADTQTEPLLRQEIDDEDSLKVKNDLQKSFTRQLKFEDTLSAKDQVSEAFVKVFQKMLLMKSQQLCEACHGTFDDFAFVIKEGLSIKKFSVQIAEKNGSCLTSHRADCLIIDAFKLITFHTAFIANSIAWPEGFQQFLDNMRMMLDSTNPKDEIRKEINEMFHQVQQAANFDHSIGKEVIEARELLTKVMILILQRHIQ